MKILVLGNGFDLAHKLPTSYNDFLLFIKACNNNYVSDKIQHYQHLNDCIVNLKSKIIDSSDLKGKTFFDKVNKLSRNNTWIHYFKQKQKDLGENWLDFESEIFKNIKYLEKNDGDRIGINQNNKEFLSFFQDYLCTTVSRKATNDLHDLINLLELYLKEVVCGLPKNKIPFFENEKFDKVISFNYTNTYRELYDNVEIDFIHGEADYKEKNNMVLGIEESLSSGQESSNVLFIEFKKYFQRIEKQTGATYKKWINQIKDEENGTSEIHIFGHSLDTADSDIIIDLFDEEIIDIGTKIIVYYHKDDVKKQLIKNLVKVLSKSRVIKLTNKLDEKIEFIYLNTEGSESEANNE